MGSCASILSAVIAAGLVVIPAALYLASRANSARDRADERATDGPAGHQQLLAQAELNTQALLKQAERDADALRKEATIEAREKAHTIAAEADQRMRERREEMLALEQQLADKTRALADRLTATDRLEQDLRGRERALAAREEAVTASAARSEELIAERQRELQRVAGLSADEARELLLRQLEGEARRDAANMVKRLETEARETAAVRAQQSSPTPSSAALPSMPSRRPFQSSIFRATTSRGGSSAARDATSARSKPRPVSS